MKRRLLVLFACLSTLVLVGEGGFRLARERLGFTDVRLQRARDYYLQGRVLGFELRTYTAFQRPAGDGANLQGFFDEDWEVERRPGFGRIICLGASTTESGNKDGRAGSYPYLLQRQMRQAGARVEVYKAGISGWTTAEGVASWFLCLQDFKPDVLVIHFAANDAEPRFRADFRPDYSHWRVPFSPPNPGAIERFFLWSSDLLMAVKMSAGPVPTVTSVTSAPNRAWDPLFEQGRLNPETALAYRRNVRTIAESARSLGARVVLLTMPINEELGNPMYAYAIKEHNEHLRQLAQEEGYILADAYSAFLQRPELLAEFSDGVHLSKEGNRAKAEVVKEALLREWQPPLGEGVPLDDPDEDR